MRERCRDYARNAHLLFSIMEVRRPAVRCWHKEATWATWTQVLFGEVLRKHETYKNITPAFGDDQFKKIFQGMGR